MWLRNNLIVILKSMFILWSRCSWQAPADPAEPTALMYPVNVWTIVVGHTAEQAA